MKRQKDRSLLCDSHFCKLLLTVVKLVQVMLLFVKRLFTWISSVPDFTSHGTIRKKWRKKFPIMNPSLVDWFMGLWTASQMRPSALCFMIRLSVLVTSSFLSSQKSQFNWEKDRISHVSVFLSLVKHVGTNVQAWTNMHAFVWVDECRGVSLKK